MNEIDFYLLAAITSNQNKRTSDAKDVLEDQLHYSFSHPAYVHPYIQPSCLCL